MIDISVNCRQNASMGKIDFPDKSNVNRTSNLLIRSESGK